MEAIKTLSHQVSAMKALAARNCIARFHRWVRGQGGKLEILGKSRLVFNLPNRTWASARQEHLFFKLW